MEIRSKLKRGSNENGLQIGNEVLSFSPTAKNIGVVFDSSLSLECHVNSMVSSAWSSLWRIGRIRKYLSKESAEIFIHAFVTSKLDYCNSLLFGLPNTLINKIQLVQNAAARIVTLTRKYDHITQMPCTGSQLVKESSSKLHSWSTKLCVATLLLTSLGCSRENPNLALGPQ